MTLESLFSVVKEAKGSVPLYIQLIDKEHNCKIPLHSRNIQVDINKRFLDSLDDLKQETGENGIDYFIN